MSTKAPSLPSYLLVQLVLKFYLSILLPFLLLLLCFLYFLSLFLARVQWGGLFSVLVGVCEACELHRGEELRDGWLFIAKESKGGGVNVEDGGKTSPG